jgi:antitoxin MazE
MRSQFIATQSAQEWGDGLAVRIPAPIARAARISVGTTIRLEVVEGGLFLRITGKPRLTLAQKLKAFDPDVHGGEAMASTGGGADLAKS